MRSPGSSGAAEYGYGEVTKFLPGDLGSGILSVASAGAASPPEARHLSLSTVVLSRPDAPELPHPRPLGTHFLRLQRRPGLGEERRELRPGQPSGVAGAARSDARLVEPLRADAAVGRCARLERGGAHGAEGLGIAREVKRQLPDWTVVYLDEAALERGWMYGKARARRQKKAHRARGILSKRAWMRTFERRRKREYRGYFEYEIKLAEEEIPARRGTIARTKPGALR